MCAYLVILMCRLFNDVSITPIAMSQGEPGKHPAQPEVPEEEADIDMKVESASEDSTAAGPNEGSFDKADSPDSVTEPVNKLPEANEAATNNDQSVLSDDPQSVASEQVASGAEKGFEEIDSTGPVLGATPAEEKREEFDERPLPGNNHPAIQRNAGQGPMRLTEDPSLKPQRQSKKLREKRG